LQLEFGDDFFIFVINNYGKTSSLLPYDENQNFVTERYYSVTKFCIVTSKTLWIRVFLLVITGKKYVGLAPQPINFYKFEDHVWFEDRWMVASLCDE
jgi:hypothetical protein